MKESKTTRVSSRRLRIGLILFVVSFLPFPLVLLAVLHANGMLEDPKDASSFLAISWGIQYLIGFIGLFFAGKESTRLLKSAGYKQLPKSMWHVLRYGDIGNAK